MSAQVSDHLTVDTVRDIQALQIFARHIIDGLSLGRHQSRHKGFSTQFKEHRFYVPGDQLKLLDWKLYGKTDRLYIRQYEEEINLQCMLAIDHSRSMNYSGTNANGLTKFNYACALAASLSYLLLRQQDAVGLALLNSDVTQFLPARSKPSYLQDIAYTLTSETTTQEASLTQALTQFASRLKGKYLIFVVSDFLDNPDEVLRLLKLLRGARHDVVAIQVWDRDEQDFPFQQLCEFQNLEIAGHKKTLDCRQLAQAYQANVTKYQQKLTDGCREHAVDLLRCTTDQSCGTVLRELLDMRARK